MKIIIALWNILLKDIKNYYLKPPNISWGLIFPFAWILMMFIRSDANFDIQDIFPGIVTMSVLFGTTSMLAVTITFERKSRSFERLLLTPVSIELLAIAKIAGAFAFGILNSAIPVLISVFYFNALVSNWLTLIISIVFLSTVSTLLGLTIAVSAKQVFEAQTYSNFFRFPMLFLCGLFFPISMLPIILRPLSYALPVTYGVDALRYSIAGNNTMSLTLNFILLAFFSLGLFFFSINRIKSKWIT